MDIILGSKDGERQPSRPVPTATDDPPNLSRNVRVLVVEDDWLIATEIESALFDAGYAVVGIASSAAEALAMTEQLKPQIATMDVRLRGKQDGISTALELHERHGVRCLFISAFSDDETKSRAAPAEPLGWLQKPLASADIVLALHQATQQFPKQ